MAMRLARRTIAYNETTSERGIVVEVTVPRMRVDALPIPDRFPYIAMVAMVYMGTIRGFERRSWLSTDDIIVFE